MIKYRVKYILDNGVYETEIHTSTSGRAMELVQKLYPDAKNISIVSQNFS